MNKVAIARSEHSLKAGKANVVNICFRPSSDDDEQIMKELEFVLNTWSTYQVDDIQYLPETGAHGRRIGMRIFIRLSSFVGY